jgi:hypothetical protein
MIRLNASKRGAIGRAAVTLFLGCALGGCGGQGEPSPRSDAAGGTSPAAASDAGKAPAAPGQKTARVKPGSQTPGDANYSDKPNARARGR